MFNLKQKVNVKKGDKSHDSRKDGGFRQTIDTSSILLNKNDSGVSK